MTRAIRTWLTIGAALLAAACENGATPLSDGGAEPRDAGRDSGPPARPTDFACIGSVVWPLAPAPTLTMRMRLLYWGAWLGGYDDTGYPGLRVRACGAADPDCTSPSDGTTTDAMGYATLTLPTPGTGFNGYFYGTAAEVIPIRWWFYPPIEDARSRWLDPGLQRTVFSPAAIEAGPGHPPGWTYDASRAIVLATTFNCAGEGSTAPFVTLDGAAPAWAGNTDSIWFDLEPGPHTIVATLPETGDELARIETHARAGEINALSFGPMPR